MAKTDYAKSLTASKTKKVKGVSMNGLNARQINAMAKHSEHHSKKHIEFMVSAINNGASFSESHEMAMNKVGK
tara:strand:- start:12775 stop:12993 length:219 start_codon:yes stop_codon:yes gene_type:complete